MFLVYLFGYSFETRILCSIILLKNVSREMVIIIMSGLLNRINASLKIKLSLSYLLIIMIPISISGIFINYYINGTAKKEFLHLMNNNLLQVDYSISEKMDLCKNAAVIIERDRNMTNLLQSVSDSFIISTILNDLMPNLGSLKVQNSFIYRINILHGNSAIHNVKDYIYFDEGINNRQWLSKLDSLKKNNYMLNPNVFIEYKTVDTYNQFVSNPGEKINVFSIYRPLYSTYLDEIVGIIEIQIPAQILFVSAGTADTSKSFEVLNILSKEGNLLYSNTENFRALPYEDLNNAEASMNCKINGVSYQVVKRYIESIRCWYIVYIPESSIYFNNNYKVIIITVLIVVVATLAIISFALSKLLLNNLTRLSRGIEKIKGGQLNTKIAVKSADEIGKISISFNEMTERISSLMVDLEKSYQAENEAIYKSMENQIQPHFICNALDMIRMTAEVSENMDISNATSLLISYFRYNISKRQRYVSIKDELKNASDYIQISNLIKNGNIKFDMYMDNRINGMLTEYYILKFVLQPIVENSIKHGFKDKKENCQIFINIKLQEKSLYISVEDNGSGIQTDKMEKINRDLDLNNNAETETKTSEMGIGLRNISERLHHNYKNDYSLNVKSFPGFGTLVILKIPLLLYEEIKQA